MNVKADIAKVEPYGDDATRIPKCEEDGKCRWKCAVPQPGKDAKPKLEDVETVGAFVKLCVVPQMRRNEAKKAAGASKKDGPKQKNDEPSKKTSPEGDKK